MTESLNLDISRIPKELQMIIELIKVDKSNNLENSLLFQNIDWDKFIDLAMHHRVYSKLYLKIKQYENFTAPKSIIDLLSNQYQKNTFQMLHLSAEMEYISKLLFEENINHLYVKGPVIAKDLYGDISLRTSKDLDILVEINQLEKTKALLLKEGYIEEYQGSILNDWKWRIHHVSFNHPVKKVNLEIHWRLHPAPMIEPPFTELWDRRRKSELTKFPVYYLGKEDLFLFLMVHGARHGWFRLRWLVDIRQITSQELDWKKLNLMIEKYNYQKIVGQGLILANKIFGTKINDEAILFYNKKSSKLLAEKALFFLENKVEFDNGESSQIAKKYNKRYLFSIRNIKQRIILGLRVMHPSFSDYETFPLPKQVHFLYFLLRPFLVFWRNFKNRELI
ncbi:nucleotidyltransferase family protein [Neobacillus citreus]|uniref:Nucleotidyltransferase family protein n=1 Tax=Neobacillus citreus TaxID=2833578 RepID=A0A942YBQ4_9BACI|nr:nucleotidyltransferase family protein [Neobacillus citreus]MCH6266018.1 nucleotidyltransferase family protein [Neobacillus citreus]